MSNHNSSWETIKDRQAFSANSSLRRSTWAFNFTDQIGYYKHTHKGFIEPIKQLKLYSWGSKICLFKHFVGDRKIRSDTDGSYLGLLLNLPKIIAVGCLPPFVRISSSWHICCHFPPPNVSTFRVNTSPNRSTRKIAFLAEVAEYLAQKILPNLKPAT